jgi:ketosteroid isomerase-like protein
MSQENAEIARMVCEAAWQRPKPDFDTLNALVHPEHEMFTIQSLVEGGSYRGAQGFREWLASWGETFGQDWNAGVEEARTIDSEQVLISGRIQAQGQRGGVQIGQEFWVLMKLRDAKVIRSAVYTDKAQALKAAGLRE